MHLVIIGNGITGVTTARYVRKATDWDITIISSETEYFFSRTALMYIYMGHMEYEHTKPYEDHFWEKNDLNLICDHVMDINVEDRELDLREGESVSYDKLVLATGSQPNKFGWPGQDLDGVQGLYSYQDLQLMEENTKNIDRAVIVGGGLIGIEVAEMLHTRDIPVTFLVRESNYWDNALPVDEAKMINEEIRRHHIDLRLETNLEKILPDDNGRVRAVVTQEGTQIDCQFVALTPGVHPNLELVKSGPVETDRGILVNRHFETNIDDIYAAGDCAEFKEVPDGDPSIEQLWYTGRLQGECLARNLCGERKAYDRGIWFNSAKFMTIEWQTYGRVPPQLPDGCETFCWQHPDENLLLRINYKKSDRAVTGFNSFGMRLRHAVCEQWIDEGKTLEYVLEHLGEVNFDPEFCDQHESEIITYYNERYPDRQLELKQKRGLLGLFQFENQMTA
ncbi:Pyridine nucleotide-disulfide oxidoreductase [Fodinibius salinus]|uniref:Pyridine nucleotide-disulfide oxidoreductase n=1 Tax=Fodinibius salinus TaxID=860790 RepID=A0A5D3YG83_9BACT|nr:FAD-dependent oxidoreductase [Fodinibius salinus]TYP92013.1 Pyridine nucleotide-disulfide oxidoreductase [Fodinibius salinus]